MSTHTKEPWHVGKKVGRFVYAEDETPICECESLGESPDGTEAANARRIVACVNACAGVDTELLESYPAPFCKLREQRDELLAALVRLACAAECRDNTSGDPIRLISVKAELAAAAKYARSVIARSRGEA